MQRVSRARETKRRGTMGKGALSSVEWDLRLRESERGQKDWEKMGRLTKRLDVKD